MKGLWAPLVTPMRHGRFDSVSMKKLVQTLDPYVDGYVVGLATGEGGRLSEIAWKEAVSCVAASSPKPVAAAALGQNADGAAARSKAAKAFGCVALAVEASGESEEDRVAFFLGLLERSELPLILYNTAKRPIRLTENIARLDRAGNIAAIKESSEDRGFLAKLLSLKPGLKMAVLQGMENRLLESKGCDGYLVALGNVEPQLCKNMFDDSSVALNDEIMRMYHEYNLAGQHWYLTLKALLYGRGTLRSAEQVKAESSSKTILFDTSVHLGQFRIDNEEIRAACKNSQISISPKPSSQIAGMVSFNENSWTDDIVWGLGRETQDIFYKFMDVFHTVKTVTRAPLAAADARLALEIAAMFDLDFSNALTCAIAVSRDIKEIHTIYPSLLEPRLAAYFRGRHGIEIVEPSAVREWRYEEPDLERFYQDALAAFRRDGIDMAGRLHR